MVIIMEQETLRRLQLTELEILKEIKRICAENNLTYYLSSGSVIGAIRHQGFIPWDDDIDICMPWQDYEKFIELCNSGALSDKYFLQTSITDLYDHQPFIKVRKNNTTMLQPMHKNNKAHSGIWVDIFPIVSVDNGKSIFKLKKKMLSFSNYLAMDGWIIDNEEEFKGILGSKGFNLLMKFYKIPLRKRQKWHHKALKFIIHSFNNTEYKTEVYSGLIYTFPNRIFEGEAIEVPFEDDTFSVMPGYDEYLRIHYGDYMQLPPENERYNHGNLIIDFENSYGGIK